MLRNSFKIKFKVKNQFIFENNNYFCSWFKYVIHVKIKYFQNNIL